MIAFERPVIRAAVFLAGAILMAGEVAAFRIIGKSFGLALRETTAVIAVFLAAMSVGYWAGGKVGDRWPRSSSLAAAMLFAAASLVAVPWTDSVVAPYVAASLLPISAHAFVVATLLFALPTALLAAVSPMAVRLVITTTHSGGSAAGSISAISTVGSIAGSIATAFFLLEWLGSITRTIFFLAAAAALTSAMLALTEAKGAARRYAVAGLAAVVVTLSLAAFLRSPQIEASILRRSPEWNLLFSGDSPYHHITVTESRGRFRFLSFGTAAESSMDVADPFGAGLPYTDSFHIAPLIRPNVRSVLMIGLGGGTAAKQYTHLYPAVTFDVVEVDPMIVDVAKRFFRTEASERLRINVSDGRTFLRRSSAKWDLIIVDAYTRNRYGETIPPHLVTKEFFIEARSHLTAGGIVHFHCAFTGSRFLPALEKTMNEVFDATLVTGGEVLGSNAPVIATNAELAQAAERSPAAGLPHLHSYIVALHPVKPAADAPLLTDDYAPIDALLHAR